MAYKFTVKKEGYDKDQVKEVISDLAQTNKKLEKENKYLRSKLEEMTEKFGEFINKYYELERNGSKNDATSKVAQKAIDEANALIEDARKNADIIINDAISKVNSITNDALKLKMEVSAFKDNVRLLAANVMDYIDSSAVLMDNSPKTAMSDSTITVKTLIQEVDVE